MMRRAAGTQLLDKWASLWAAVTYALLAVALGIAIADGNLTWAAKASAAGISAAWGCWYWVFAFRSQYWHERITIQFVSFVSSVIAAAALSWIHPSFVLMLFGYYGISFGALPVKWAIPIVMLVSLALASRFVNITDGWLAPRNVFYLFGFLAAGFFDIVMGLFVAAIARQSRERQQMIDELEETHGELTRAERQAGVLEERQRLAGEIHDTLAQGFTSVILHLEAAEQNLVSNPAQARQHLSRALQAARENLTEARSVIWALRPEVLEAEPFDAAVRRLAGKWGAATGIRAETTVTGKIYPLPAPAEVALLRAAQEALANVLKHAQARKVSLTLSYMEDEVIMDIQDDGRGFDAARAANPPGESPLHGYGLSTMRRRVEELGGALAVESALGEGTTIAIRIPLHCPSKGEGSS